VVCGLLALTGGSEWVLAGLLFLAGSVFEGISDLAWNGMLPELAGPTRRDAVSARATAVGYVGAGLLLAAELAFTDAHHSLGMSKATAVRVCFLLAGIWWAGFGLAALRRLQPTPRREGLPNQPGALAQLRAGYRTLRSMPQVGRFVVAYLCFADAVSAVISLASTFLTHQLFDDDTDKASTFLFALILLVQFVAIVGAVGFARLARRTSTKAAVLATLAVWFAVIVFAYAILDSEAEAVVMGLVVGLALGGTTALARSLFSQMIPSGAEATFFSLFEVCSQGTAWLAPLIFTVVVDITGSFRQAILSLIVLFILGFVLLLRVDPDEAARQARQASLPIAARSFGAAAIRSCPPSVQTDGELSAESARRPHRSIE
jgi:MFS transporter, UMF1 family